MELSITGVKFRISIFSSYANVVQDGFTVNVKVLDRYEYGVLFLAASSIRHIYISSFTVQLFSRNKISFEIKTQTEENDVTV